MNGNAAEILTEAANIDAAVMQLQQTNTGAGAAPMTVPAALEILKASVVRLKAVAAAFVGTVIPPGTGNGVAVSLSILPAGLKLIVGSAAQGLMVTALDANGVRVLSPAPQFASSNPAVASVDVNGNVTPVGAGTAIITVTSGAVSGNAPVSVTLS